MTHYRRIKACDIVRLKWGGPDMTVKAVDTHDGVTRVHSTWIDRDGEKAKGVYGIPAFGLVSRAEAVSAGQA